MKTILRFLCAAAFVWTFAIGVAAVTVVRFGISMILPSKAETTEQVVQAPVVAVAPVNDDFSAEPSLVDTQPEIFDAGNSYALDTRRVPKAFADIEFLNISTHEYLEENGEHFLKPIVPTGNLWTGKDFELKSLTIADREITLETREMNGVSYKFVGYFPRYPDFGEYCEGCEYPPDLKGKLTKLKDGKIIAETIADFYVWEC